MMTMGGDRRVAGTTNCMNERRLAGGCCSSACRLRRRDDLRLRHQRRRRLDLAYHAAARVLSGQPAYDTSYQAAGGFGLFIYPPTFIP